MEERPKRAHIMLRLLITCSLLFVASTAHADQRMSTADRLRMLYASQLQFTQKGDPIIRLGLLENVPNIKFTPSEPFRVLPQGEEGPEILLPAGRTYTVSIDQARKGDYKHWVIAARIPVAQRERAEAIKNTWLKRGYLPEVFEVGGLFAVRGKVFDSRTILITLGGSTKRRTARKLQRTLRAKYGIEGGLHSQLVKHPTGLLTLKGDGVLATIRHRDILQIAAQTGREERIRYTVPGIKKSYKKGTMTRTYTGRLIFAPHRNGKLVLINSLGAERALKGVVPAEIYASAPPAALQAQAIAARNEIFSAIGVRNLADPYMLRADVMDQVYGGVGIEHPRTSRAVDATRGRVMFYNKEIIEAFYSSNAGGVTENNENVWDMEPRPYLRGKPDAKLSKVPRAFHDGISNAELQRFLDEGFPAHSKNAPVSSSRLFRWKTSVPVNKPTKWLKDAGHKIGAIKDVKILERGVSGRIKRLHVIGTRGKAIVERELNVRRLFGGLKSGLFTMKIDRNSRGLVTQLHFHGAGFGHGVGMCQTGAVGMATQGKSAADILTHYYRGVEVKPLY